MLSQLFSWLPFGPSIYLMFLALGTTAGIALFARTSSRKMRVVIVGLAVCLVLPELSTLSVELNPRVERQDLVGHWRDGFDTLSLKEDGSYELRWRGKTYWGTWEAQDWNLRLYPDHGEVGFYPRVVKAGLTYRMPTYYPNIDEWDGDLGMR